MADHKDYWTTAGDQGAIKISEDVVASIAALAASETEGVSSLYSSFTKDIASFLGKKNLSKGVHVVLGEDDTVEVQSMDTAFARLQKMCRNLYALPLKR